MATVQTLHHSPEMRVSLRFGAVVMMILGGCLLTPALLPTGSVPELSARANAFDYATYDGLWSLGNRDNSPLEWGHDQPEHGLFRWSDAGLIGGIFYAIGDLNCHQKHERSHMVNGNQIPMCARDVGILAGLLLGAVIFGRRGNNRWTSTDTILSILPESLLIHVYRTNRRRLALITLGAITLIPLVLDGFTQLLTPYESTNLLRILTGIPFGWMIGVGFLGMLCARPDAFSGDPTRVELPGNARFITEEE